MITSPRRQKVLKRHTFAAHRTVTVAALFILFALMACNMPGCGQPGPTPDRTPIPPTVDFASLPPTSPQIVAQRPYPGEEIPLTGSIDLYFDQPMDQASVLSALQIDPPLQADYVWVDDSTLRINPASGQLQRAQVYEVLIAESAKSTRGLNMDAPFEGKVQTVGFLSVGEVVPAPDAGGVETNSVITVFFNRPVVPLTIAENMADQPHPLTFTPDVPGTGEWINTSIYQWTPSAPLAGGSTYTVTVDGSLVDQMGGVMSEPFTWSFTTLPPMVIEVTPSDGLLNVGLDKPVTVQFNQPMDHASTEAAFSLVETSSDQRVAGAFEWDEDSALLTFKPSGGLSLDGRYRVTVESSAQGASGGLTLSNPQQWAFSAVATPAIASTDPADGADGVNVFNGIHITFTAPMDLETVTRDGMLVVDPPLPEETTLFYSDYDFSLNANIELEPSTRYTVTYQPGASDPYGNRIDEPYTFSFTTGPLDPLVQLNVQGLFGVYDADQATELFALYRNVSRVDFRLARLDLARFIELTNYDNLSRYQPSSNDIVREWGFESEGALNEATYSRVSMTTDEGASLPPGIYLLIADAPEVEGEIRHFVIVTNANLTYKGSFDETLVWLTDLHSGQPLSDIPVTFYDEFMNQIAQGSTGSSGVLEAATPRPQGLYQPRFAVAEGQGVFALAGSQWSDGISPWDFGLPASYDFQDFSLYMYTDRPLYRPGQDVFFKGVLRGKNDVAYSLPSASTIHIMIYNDQGDMVTEQDLPISEEGTFSGTLSLDTEASLGYYSINAMVNDRGGGVGFQVAEYRRPEFLVNVIPEHDEVADGDTINVTVDTEFFFGGPVSDAEVTWNVLPDSYYYLYDGPGTYSFADFDTDIAPDTENFIPGFGEVIASGAGTTDANGNYVITLPASLEESKTSRRLTIEAVVTDVNAQSVAGRAEVIVHKGEYYVGVSPDVYVGTAGDEMSANLLVVDWQGEPVARQDVTVQILERRWSSVQEEDEQGRTQWTWNVEEIPVGDPIEVRTNGEGRASVDFTPPEGGIYKIRATVADPQGRTQSGAQTVWVSGREYVSWRQTNNDRIDLVTDKRNYAPGNTAEILIAHPFQGEVQALITIERGSILTHQVITLDSNSYVYRLPIVGDLAPNVFFSVVIVKGVDETNPIPAFKMGSVEIPIDPIEQTLNLEVTPDRTEVGPGEEVTYTVRTTDFEGNEVDAEVSLALVDLATLSLSQPNSGPIVQHFYGVQPLSVQTSVSMIYLVNRRNQELFDQGKGGGGGGGEGFFDIRTDFRDTAYWTAQIRTGEDGEESVTIKLPDNLTTWRMDARGVTTSTLVGQSTGDIVATKPLLIRPVTPRFFTVEDEVTLSAVVNNNTDNDINAEVTLQANGVEIQGAASQVVNIPARGRVEVAWPVIVTGDSQWADLTFLVEGGRLQDASKPTLGDPDHDQQLPILRYEVPETVGTAGQLVDAEQKLEGIVLPPTYDITDGYVRVQIDPSLAASTVDALDWLEDYPYDCTEQIVSRFLPNALTLSALRQLGINDPALEANLNTVVGTALQQLYAQQHVDGGWGWKVSAPSNATTTAYAIQGMIAAREAGIPVEQQVIDAGVMYLSGQLRPLDTLDAHWKLNRQSYILYVLARGGQPDVSRTVQLYENRQGLQHWSRALLAQTLWMIDPNDPRLEDIKSDLVNSAILSATGAHWEEDAPDFWNWNTDTRSTAIILDTFALLWPDSDLAPNITRWLMVARTAGHWETTQETAWALIGLTHWMSNTGELHPNYTWDFQFNGAKMLEGQANDETVRQSQVLTILVQDLAKDEVNRFLFERTAGPGRMYYTAHLVAYLPVEKVEPLSRGVIVSRRYLNEQGNPVTQGRVGDILTVEVTIIAPNDLYFAVVEDPYPAGAEPIDTSLEIESVLNEGPQLQPDDPLARGWGWWWFSDTDFRDEKAVMYAETLPKGTYQYTYQLRLGLPGTFRVIPTTAREFYMPEVYGRGNGVIFTILP